MSLFPKSPGASSFTAQNVGKFVQNPLGGLRQLGGDIARETKAGAGAITKELKKAGKGTTPKIAAEEIIQDVPVVNPYEESLRGALGTPTAPDFAKASEIGASQTGLAKQLENLYGTGAAGMTGLINQLQQQFQGNFGPGGSLAQALLQQGMGQNIAGVRSQLASQRGLSPALAARYAAQQTAALGGQTAQQAGILGLQQQLAAQQQLGQLSSQAAQTGGGLAGQILGQARGQEIQQGATTSEAALQRLQTLAQSDVGMRQIAAQTGMSANQIRAKIAEANQAAAAGDRERRDKIIGTILEGGSKIGAAMASAPPAPAAGAAGSAAAAAPVAAAAALNSGGRIDGVAQVDGDHPQNDTVPAMLSPGEIVIPRTSAKSKKAAKSFIDSLNDFDEPVGFKDVLKARQKKNFNDGGKVASTFGVTPYSPERSNPETNRMMYQHYMDQVRTQPMAEDKMPWNVPFPPGVEAQRKVDEALSSYVVEPLAKRGYENLGAALAAGSSAAASMAIPQNEAEAAGVILPIRKIPLRGKAFKEGKALELLDIMKSDDVDINKLPTYDEFKKISKQFKTQKIKQTSEDLFLRSQQKKQEASKTAVKVKNSIFDNPDFTAGYSTDLLENLAQDNLNNKKIAKAWNEYEMTSQAVPWNMAVAQTTRGTPINNLEFQKRMNAYQISRKKLYDTLNENKDDLKLTDEMEKIKKVREFKK